MVKKDSSTQRQLDKVLRDAADSLEQEVWRLAGVLVDVFPKDDKKTQVSALERQGLTALRLGDVVAYVMRQTGKETGRQQGSGPWSRGLGKEGCLGEQLVRFLAQVKERADAGCGSELADHRNELRMKLAGICLRNLHSAYLYQSVVGKGAAHG